MISIARASEGCGRRRRQLGAQIARRQGQPPEKRHQPPFALDAMGRRAAPIGAVTRLGSAVIDRLAAIAAQTAHQNRAFGFWANF
ncbi:MAG TPA: hypothetical protein VLV86_03385 [Vicinamibacterales bacterium]|nr:hypothetical protein [Vicinamibacterales bacterium]